MTETIEPPTPIANSFIALTTERLTLRAYRPDDAAELHRLINDWEVCRNLAFQD